MSQKVLVADDSVASQRLFELVLTREGYDVTTVSSGAEAIQTMKETQPDLALIDAVMPEMDGYHLCRTLKGNPKLKHMPIVLLAGKHEEVDREKGLQAGSDAILDKPAKSNDILAKVKEFLEKKPVAEATAAAPQSVETEAPVSDHPVVDVVQEPPFVEEEYEFDEESEEVDLAVESEILDEEAEVESESYDYEELDEGDENFSLEEEGALEEEPDVEEAMEVEEELEVEEEVEEEDVVAEAAPAAPQPEVQTSPTQPTAPAENIPMGELSDQKLDMIADEIAQRLAGKLAPVIMQEFMSYLLRIPSVQQVVQETSKDVMNSLLSEGKKKTKK